MCSAATNLALKLREDFGHRRRRPRRGWREIEHAGARAAQVALLRVDHVHQRLGAGDVMHSRDHPLLDGQLRHAHGASATHARHASGPKECTGQPCRTPSPASCLASRHLFVDDLDHGCDAVGRARRRGADDVRGVELVIIHANDDIEHALLLHRCRHDDALDTADVNVRHQLLDREEDAIACDDEIHALALPIHLGKVLLFGEADGLAVDGERSRTGRFHLLVPGAMHTVVFDEVSRSFAATNDLVDVHNLDLRHFPRKAECEPANASEAVDADLDGCHRLAGLKARKRGCDEERRVGVSVCRCHRRKETARFSRR